MLREMVPHTERSNTATFLEELINYINLLKIRLAELESTVQVGLPPTASCLASDPQHCCRLSSVPIDCFIAANPGLAL